MSKPILLWMNRPNGGMQDLARVDRNDWDRLASFIVEQDRQFRNLIDDCGTVTVHDLLALHRAVCAADTDLFHRWSTHKNPNMIASYIGRQIHMIRAFREIVSTAIVWGRDLRWS